MTSPGGTNSTTAGISVEMLTNFTATPLEGFTGMTVQFNDTSLGNPDTWTWSFGDGSTSALQNPTHSYTTAGTYSVTLTAGVGLVNDTEIKTDLITVTDPAPSPTPTPAIIRGGGGGSGHSEIVYNKGTGILLTSFEGKLLRETSFISSDGIATLALGQNTIALSSDDEPLSEITIESINATDVPENMNGAFTFAGSAYSCTPSGATFAPAITILFTLSADEWNALNEGDFTIRFYDDATGEWVELPTTVNPETHTVTAEVTHFSVFGLFTTMESSTVASSSQSTVTPVATAPTDTMTGSQGDTTTAPETTQSAPLLCVPLLALGALAILRKRR